jgi:hypothetical protein
MLSEIETNAAIVASAKRTIEACQSTLQASREVRRESNEAIRRASATLDSCDYKFNYHVEPIPTDDDEAPAAAAVALCEDVKAENFMHDKRNPKVNNDDLCCHDKDARFEREDAGIKPRHLIADLDGTEKMRRQALGKSKMSRHQKTR